MNPISWVARALKHRARRATCRMRRRPGLRVMNPARRHGACHSPGGRRQRPKAQQGTARARRACSRRRLWIVPCESVHTFFMRFPIDLVYLDRKHRIKRCRNAVGPWRLSACLSAHSVLELPAGTIRNTQTQPGDTLEFLPAAPDNC